MITASRTEQMLVNAPATVTLIDSRTIENSPATNYADLLRAVPGLNVTQTSARDINITSRSATGTLATSQLALVDGRSIYLDFFGFVAWDFLPIDPQEIKQIEVIRGPASAVWGANALTGVVNIITKTPRESPGSTFILGGGLFGRDAMDVEKGSGALFSVSASHAAAVNDRWAYKVATGYYQQDAMARPSGPIPDGAGQMYPDFPNSGTRQPKFDARLDYDHPDGRRKVVMQGGFAGTEGMIHSGIGPFDIDRGTYLAYGKVNYTHGATRLNTFVNRLDGSATNLLAVGLDGLPIPFVFKTTTFDVEAGHVATWRNRHVFSLGGNFRYNGFDLSLAPLGDSRTEGGAYGQDEIFLSPMWRWLIGGRVDAFSVLDGPVFSPRTTLLFKPDPAHTVRVSYNRAYRAPSLVNNFLDTTILSQLDLGALNPALAGRTYVFPVAAVGNQNLTEESLDAYEIGYSGVIANRATVSAAFYVNDSKNSIFFTQDGSYRAANPPPGWPLPPAALELIYLSGRFGPGNGLPASYTYLNFGKVRQKGFELGVDTDVSKGLTAFANYSFQPTPEPTGFDISELNLPPRHRVNLGANYTGGRVIGNLAMNYVGEAYWQDVSSYQGTTEAYTLVNGTLGYRWNDSFTTSLKVINLFDQEIQQHIFGDVMRRQVVLELRMRVGTKP
ncbi:TonB-dependent receptor plug domain-containing protein [Luteitalea pratensis]|uniref:TonB-dependent receptor plug domain-containing protein n=1 Tax=Luteitalea pratensis TaxID=1855912 RepID=UPI001390349E|nr:TonB-dependent receptor [Luteitalea pratensis]